MLIAAKVSRSSQPDKKLAAVNRAATARSLTGGGQEAITTHLDCRCVDAASALSAKVVIGRSADGEMRQQLDATELVTR